VASPITIRAWAKRDRDAVQGLLSLLAPDAPAVAGDAPTYVAEADDEVVGMVTVCVFTTLTGRKAYLDHLMAARTLYGSLGFHERDTGNFRLPLAPSRRN
jgi:hypothetical protein